MPKVKRIPTRSEIAIEDTWDLTRIFKSDAAWEKAYKKLELLIPEFAQFRGKLGSSAQVIRDACEFEIMFDKLAEHVSLYAHLKYTEDVANSACQGMVGRVTYLGMHASEAASYLAPEIQAIPKKKMDAFLNHPALEPFKLQLERLLRFKPHILSEKEERVLAMQGETSGTASKVFGQLNDADMKFGFVKNERGTKVELTQGSFRSLLESPRRNVRRDAFDKFYAEYAAHGNTLAATLSGSVLNDVYHARVRNFPSAREAALFSDKVPLTVYDSLIEAVHNNLDTVYRYLELRRKTLKLKDIRAYDTYAPMVPTRKVNNPYDTAVASISDALAPLGDSYVKTLREGLLGGRWVDRYENHGKRSGAFSSGAFGTPPYIMMNYKDDVLDSMFTLAHEAGHSMHTHFSYKHQPYQYSHYTIFVAEVASTFNEQLLNKHLLGKVKNRNERAQIINREIDEIRGTIIRQTMFAEYEKIIHEAAEAGTPLTLEMLRAEYRKLLALYFGPGFTIDEQLDLEGLRIPHFYSAFYVYKYATGLSAAIALSRAVLAGGELERKRYLKFLSSGGSKYPLELLRDAGVDLEQPHPVNDAMAHFNDLVAELETLL